MAVAKPQRGDQNWDVSLNAKLDDLDLTVPGSANALAASGTYVPALVPNVAGDGATDDATVIQTQLTAAGTATRTRRVLITGGSTGVVIVGATLIIPSGVTLELAPGITLRRKVGFTGNLIQNNAVQAGGRDTKVGLILGASATIDGGDNSAASTGVALHHIRFRHVDGLLVSGGKVTSTGGKFAVNLGDCTKFLVENIDLAVSSDGVHLNGPCSNGLVRNITGSTGDDSVALIANDWAGTNDVSGDLADIVVENINTTSTAACNTKVISGVGFVARNITFRGVAGTNASRGFVMGDDAGSVNTQGGTYSNITVEDVRVTYPAGGSAVWLSAVNGDQVKLSRIKGTTVTNTPLIDVTGASALDTLTVTDAIVVSGAQTGWSLLRLAGTGTIQTVNVERPTITGASGSATPFLNSGATTVNEFTIDGLTQADLPTAQTTFQANSGAVIKQLTFRGCNVRYGDTTTSNLVVPLAGSTIGQVSLVAGNYFSQGRCLFSNNTGGTSVHVVISDTYVAGTNRLSNLLAPVEFTLGAGLTCDTLINAAIFLGTGATVVVRGQGPRTVGTFTLLQRNATQSMRLNGPTLPFDVSTLTPVDGDLAFNTNGALGCGTGPAVYNTTAVKWKGLYSGLTN